MGPWDSSLPSSPYPSEGGCFHEVRSAPREVPDCEDTNGCARDPCLVQHVWVLFTNITLLRALRFRVCKAPSLLHRWLSDLL